MLDPSSNFVAFSGFDAVVLFTQSSLVLVVLTTCTTIWCRPCACLTFIVSTVSLSHFDALVLCTPLVIVYAVGDCISSVYRSATPSGAAISAV
jgi:hypothetical protein